jgi:hypothetical protein
MALLVLRSVGLCVGQNQMCHFVRLAFWVVFLSVYGCSVGRHRVAANLFIADSLLPFHSCKYRKKTNKQFKLPNKIPAKRTIW